MSLYRITVEDVETGVSSTMEVHSGDYVLLPIEPCRVVEVRDGARKGEQIIILRGVHPQGPQRLVAE